MSPFVKFLLFVVIGFVLIMSSILWFVTSTMESHRRERYPAWVKLTGRSDITYEEFRQLDIGGHLKASQK